MKLLLNAVMVFGALVMAFAQNSTDLVQGGVNSAQSVPAQGTWRCVPVKTRRVTYTNTSAPFAVGDCIVLDDDVMHKIPINQTLRLAGSRGWSFPDNTYGDFVLDTSCKGYRLHTTHIITQPSGGGQPGIKCDEGFKAVYFVPVTPQTQCSMKYGTPEHPVWDLLIPMCLAACPAGQYPYLGWCIPGCSDTGNDIGLACERVGYYPHCYTVWPFGTCAEGYQHRDVSVCIQNCKPGYSPLEEVLLFSCQRDCPPDTFPVLSVCWKNQHDRLARLAEPAYMLAVQLLFVLATGAIIAVAAAGAAIVGAEVAVVAERAVYPLSSSAHARSLSGVARHVCRR